jgi:very-short-patch-repair endonuclease
VAVHPGVYALPLTDDLRFAADAAALLACRPGAALCNHSAAILWRLRVGVARPVHVIVPAPRRGPTLTGVIVHRSRTLTNADVRIHEGLPVTSPARVLLDIAPRLPDRDLERLRDEALFVQKITTQPEIEDQIARAGGHPGAGRFARVCGRRAKKSTTTDSGGEERLLRLIRAAGLPKPEQHVPMLGYELDFYWPHCGVAVEVDTYGTHSSPAKFEADRRRDARLLTEKRIAVIRMTDERIEQRPHEVVVVLARAVA